MVSTFRAGFVLPFAAHQLPALGGCSAKRLAQLLSDEAAAGDLLRRVTVNQFSHARGPRPSKEAGQESREMAHTGLDHFGARTLGDFSASRRPVVLLHGFASTPATLAFLARYVSHQLNRRVLRPSLGFGWGDLSTAAQQVAAAIAAARFDEVDVVGHSLGG